MKSQNTRIYRYATIGLLGLTVAFAGFAGTAGAQGNTTKMTVQTPSSDQPLKQGDPDINVNILASDVHNLAGFQFSLKYNPSVLKFVDVKENAFLGSTGRQVNCPTKNDNGGLVQFICVTMSPPVSRGGKAGPEGTGTLAVVTFSPSGGGDSGLDLSDVKLVGAEIDQGGMPVETTPSIENASIHVVGTGGGFPWLVIGGALGAVVVIGAIGGGGLVMMRRRS
jgi:hypothetical protein